MKIKFFSLLMLTVIVFACSNEEVAETQIEQQLVINNNFKEGRSIDPSEKIGTSTVPIVWIGEAEYPGNMNYLQTRADTRAYYQSSWGMSSSYTVVDDNREIWRFESPEAADDVEGEIGKDDTVNVDGGD